MYLRLTLLLALCFIEGVMEKKLVIIRVLIFLSACLLSLALYEKHRFGIQSSMISILFLSVSHKMNQVLDLYAPYALTQTA